MGKGIGIIDPIGGKAGMDFYNAGLIRGLLAQGLDVIYFGNNLIGDIVGPELKEHGFFDSVWTKSTSFGKAFNLAQGYYKSIRRARAADLKILHLHVFHFDFLSAAILLTVKLLFRGKVIATVHDVNDFKTQGGGLYRSRIIRWFDGIIIHNIFSRKALEAQVRPKKIAVIPHGNFVETTRTFRYNHKEGALRLLFFGQIKKVKGLDILLRAMTSPILLERGVVLTVAGKLWHDDLVSYDQMLKALDSRVVCDFNFIAEKKAEQYFEEADVVVLPYREIFQSGVLMKAMSHGRVVIASDLEPFREIITHAENGFLFRSGDSRHLAEIIALANENQTQFPRMAERALAKINADYDWIQIGKKTSEFYDVVIQRGETGN